jgi:hypothetical protein
MRSDFKADCVRAIEKELQLTFKKDHGSSYVSVDGTAAIVCAISKDYQKRSFRYWYSFHPYQTDFLAKYTLGFVVLGCGSPEIIFLIPFQAFEPWIKKLNNTKRDDGTYYYHIRISVEASSFYLQFQGRGKMEDITKFRLKVFDADTDSTLVADIEKIKSSKTTDPTTMQALVNARVGQGKFGLAVRELWNYRCSVTGASTKAALEASHIKRWADSNDAQRLDPNNGLLLTANLHKLFDAGLISFDDSGKMLVSSKLSQSEQEIFGVVGKKLSKKPSVETANYLSHHRTKFLA